MKISDRARRSIHGTSCVSDDFTSWTENAVRKIQQPKRKKNMKNRNRKIFFSHKSSEAEWTKRSVETVKIAREPSASLQVLVFLSRPLYNRFVRSFVVFHLCWLHVIFPRCKRNDSQKSDNFLTVATNGFSLLTASSFLLLALLLNVLVLYDSTLCVVLLWGFFIITCIIKQFFFLLSFLLS